MSELHQDFKVDDKVRVYRLMHPRKDLLGEKTIENVGPMHVGGESMLWFKEGGGAWHPDACEKIEKENQK